MRIVLDLQSCQSGSRFGGIGRYSLELAKAMVRLAPEDEFLIVLNDRNASSIEKIRREFLDLLPPDNFRIFSAPRDCFYHHDDGVIAAAAELLREQFILDLKPDFVHISSLFEGFLDNVVVSVQRSGVKIPTAVTLYDLIPLVQEERYLQDERARAHYISKFDELKKTDLLLAISDFSAHEALGLIKDYSGDVEDIRGGIDTVFKVVPNVAKSIKNYLVRTGVKRPFLLYTASFDQRKNQAALIEAFASLSEELRRNHQLVIVGDGWPAVYQHMRQIASRHGLKDDDVVFAGRVSDEELIGLYNVCKLFVFPSLWEGLGLPVLEAMACGAPVIGSNTTSVPEVLGWDAASFDPTDVTSIAGKITQALTDETFYTALKAHGAKHSLAFTWEKSAVRALSAIRAAHQRLQNAPQLVFSANQSRTPRAELATLLKTDRYSDERIWEFACCLAANELESGSPDAVEPAIRLGWVTSWNTRCGIASYSANLLKGWASDVQILAPNAFNLELEDGENVWRCWVQGKDCDLEQLSLQVDNLNLTDIVIQFNFGFFNFEALSRFIERQVNQGRRVYITLHSTHDTMDLFGHRLSDLRRALSLCNSVLVHADHDISRLGRIGVSQNVVQIPQGVARYGRRSRDRLGGHVQLASYGFFLPNKGLLELIEAVAILRKGGRDVRLRMVNAHYGLGQKISDDEIKRAEAKVSLLNLSQYVEFVTEYLEDEASVSLLQEADLVVYAYQETGESSSAAVRTGLSSGTPVAVTPLRIFDDVSEATFRLPGVRPDELADGIGDLLDRLRTSSADIEKRAALAEAWCASHDVGSVRARIGRLITREAATAVWQQVLDLPASTLSPGESDLHEGLRRSVRPEGGMLVHGPYIRLESGLYRLIARGASKAADDGRIGEVRITSACGAEHIETLELGTTIPNIIFDRLIRVDRDADQAEFMFSYAPGANVELSGYQLLRLAAQV